ncbi:TAXI family TRAP transporter solute-binding subunit [Nannocystis pusilla]|uniref:RCK N-terminal domain-containing protein n=1 Tax=Nannocystis pusilla TaxID=889268 RepID=A0ABS7U0R8_9BACT|nr:TAXI family TRAP transporter solute-binding subunit [Nannocystis pusilla]MBZ5714119.1 hypothetical protein [Nannocystis pusilla]
MFKRTWLFGPVLVGMLFQAGSARAGEAIEVRFGSGSKGGGFDAMVRALAEAVRGEGRVTVVPETTKGSCENVHKLLSGELDVALVQYDVAAEAYKAGQADAGAGGGATPKGGWMCKLSPEEADKAELQVVAAVTDAAVHVLVRRPVRLDDFTDIGREALFMGKDGSGSYETAKVILGAAGHTAESLPLFMGSAQEALVAMSRREVLTMLRTTELGHAEIRDVLASGLATLNPLPEAVLNRLIDGYPYYRICPIETGTYPGLEFSLPTVCVSSVVLMATPRERLADEAFLADRRLAVEAMIHGLRKLERDEQYAGLGVNVEWRGFAEREPIPLHPVAEIHETSERRTAWLQAGASAAALGLALYLIRRALRRRRVPGAGLESQLSNPLVPFAAFACVVTLSTFIVWSLEHDSNARLRTLNDSFWEMNTFATGNFTTDTLKTPTARLVGAAATILGLGLLAWFTATLTNIFAQEQTRLWRRLKHHLVVLNFREDMLPLIRLLRSPGPTRTRALHVVVSDALPRRVRLQLARVKALTIHHSNPEVPEDLAGLRLPRAARVIVLGDGDAGGEGYDPLRIARAVHQACARDPVGGGQRARTLGVAATSVEIARTAPALPVTLVETSDAEREEVFSPFAGWLVPVDCQALAHRWLVMACRDRAFAELFNRVVAFADDNAEVYTAPAPTWLIGQPWRKVRRALLEVQGRGGAVPLGLYRAADPGGKVPAGGSSHAELRRRLIVNPRPDEAVAPGDLIVALCEDEADLVRIVAESRKTAPAPG